MIEREGSTPRLLPAEFEGLTPDERQKKLEEMGFRIVDTTPSQSNLLPTDRVVQDELDEKPLSGEDILSDKAKRTSIAPSADAKSKQKFAEIAKSEL
jgi:hypothetical protein